MVRTDANQQRRRVVGGKRGYKKCMLYETMPRHQVHNPEGSSQGIQTCSKDLQEEIMHHGTRADRERSDARRKDADASTDDRKALRDAVRLPAHADAGNTTATFLGAM